MGAVGPGLSDARLPPPPLPLGHARHARRGGDRAFRAGVRREPETDGRHVHRTPEDVDRAHHLLHGRARDLGRRRSEEGRPGRGEGSRLFRNRFHPRARDRASRRERPPARKGIRRRSADARRERDRGIREARGGTERLRLFPASHSEVLPRRPDRIGRPPSSPRDRAALRLRLEPDRGAREGAA